MSIFVPELPFQPELDKKQGYLEVQKNVEKLRKVVKEIAANPSNPWVTGDTKISSQPATHVDPLGGTWYLADGSAIPGGETGLIAQLGANFPDARGRSLVMKGTHVDVDAIGDNDGIALANRRPKHNTTLSDPGHIHNITSVFDQTSGGGSLQRGLTGDPGTNQTQSASTGITAQAAGASGGADQPAFIVPGNLFYHS